jgi:hypothetical protein
MAPNLGWIAPQDRTQQQMDAHVAAVKAMPKFAIAGGRKTLNKGEKIVLYDFLDAPESVSDIGFLFPWFHQNTGSCVGASLGNIGTCLAGVQRFNPDNPTKAYVPYWPYAYGMTRTDEGDRSKGDGAINSVAVERAKKGVLPLSEMKGLPQFQHTADDGLQLSEDEEYSMSIATSQLRAFEQIAIKFPIGTAAVANDTDDLIEGVINGYPGYGGCSRYVGNGTLKGSGENACVVGRFDSNGGHSTGFVGAWNHPDFGDMLLYANSHPKSSYPRDPSVKTFRCTVWLPRSEVDKIFTQLDGRGEYFNLSHAEYFPAQPWVTDWIM